MAGTESQRPLLWYDCPVCGKRFTTYAAVDGWAYRFFNGKVRIYYCSYNCMRVVEKEKEEKKKYRYRGDSAMESKKQGRRKKNENSGESNTGE